ncbi:SpaH/EbpB family LPXTG-anchored major pilin [Vagococcus sp. JNUCC 83]
MKLVKSKVATLFLMFALVLPTFLSGVVAVNAAVSGSVENPSLTILKKEQEPGTKPGDAGTGLPGQKAEGTPVKDVTFTLKKTHHFDPTTDTWTEVSGDDAVEISAVTNKEGLAVFNKDNGLELGRYEVHETDGPAHVILNKEAFTVDVPMTSKDGKDLNYDVHVYPKNETVRGDVELTKKNEEGAVLPGITFDLFNADGTKAKDSEGNEIPVFTTDEHGKVAMSGLAAGKYYFQEKTTLPGLALNTTKLEFEVKKDAEGQKVVVEWTTDGKYLSANGKEAEMINYKQPKVEKDVEEKTHHDVDRGAEYKYNLTIKTPNDIENYALLGVKDTLDERLEYAGNWEVTGTTKDNIDFKQNGQTLVWEVKDLSKLAPGKDVRVTFTAKIKKDAVLKPEEMDTGIPNTANIDFDNGRESYTKPKDPNNPPTTPPLDPPPTPPVTVRPKDGGLKVLKVDKNDHALFLEGAEFKLTTDKEGNDVIDATETSIRVNGEVFTGKLENIATDKDGAISITGLTPGTYYLHETKAPTYSIDGEEKSYRLLTKPLEVTVLDKVNDKEVTVENSKSGWNLPTTGGLGTLLFTLGGLSFMFMAFVLIFKRDKKAA